MPFQQVPLLEIDGLDLVQSQAQASATQPRRRNCSEGGPFSRPRPPPCADSVRGAAGGYGGSDAGGGREDGASADAAASTGNATLHRSKHDKAAAAVSQRLNSMKSLVYLGLLALQFGLQPVLARRFVAPGAIKSVLILSSNALKIVLSLGTLYVFEVTSDQV